MITQVTKRTLICSAVALTAAISPAHADEISDMQAQINALSAKLATIQSNEVREHKAEKAQEAKDRAAAAAMDSAVSACPSNAASAVEARSGPLRESLDAPFLYQSLSSFRFALANTLPSISLYSW